jgi:hypothetical protein
LFVSTKGSPTTPGKIFVYPVTDGVVSSTATVSQPSGLLLDFSFSFLGGDSRAVVTDPAYGASIIDVSKSFGVSVSKKITVQGQGAICWSVYSERFNTIFLMDGGKSNITLVDPSSGEIKGVAVSSAAGMGSLDAQIAGTYLYVLRGAPLVSVLDNSGLTHGAMPNEVQSFDLRGLGSRQGFTGMAVYPS